VIVIGTDRARGSIGTDVAIRGAGITGTVVEIIAGRAGTTIIGARTSITAGDIAVQDTGTTFQMITSFADGTRGSIGASVAI
jgi:hypothetical protein